MEPLKDPHMGQRPLLSPISCMEEGLRCFIAGTCPGPVGSWRGAHSHKEGWGPKAAEKGKSRSGHCQEEQSLSQEAAVGVREGSAGAGTWDLTVSGRKAEVP